MSDVSRVWINHLQTANFELWNYNIQIRFALQINKFRSAYKLKDKSLLFDQKN